MKVRKVILVLVAIIMVTIAVPFSLVMGGEPSPPGDGEKIVGPTMWAVGIVNCNSDVATLRVKKIEGCDVETDPQSTTVNGCPDQVSSLVNYRLLQGSVFGRCDYPNHFPIITKVKNLKSDGVLRSFDAQINFIVPDTALDTVCK
ncbi:MAG: hypothetical protein KJP19_07010 [Deltaproteobacteria bacterium]|nr:hypothetical protein [Deltaproteobacteria bacterium]